MNGPEHYVEAERLAEAYKSAITDAEAMPQDTVQQSDERYFAAANARTLLDKAQVHATLALAAAVANTDRAEGSLPLAERPGSWDRNRSGDNPTWKSVLG